jgi:hypothetical protein
MAEAEGYDFGDDRFDEPLEVRRRFPCHRRRLLLPVARSSRREGWGSGREGGEGGVTASRAYRREG